MRDAPHSGRDPGHGHGQVPGVEQRISETRRELRKWLGWARLVHDLCTDRPSPAYCLERLPAVAPVRDPDRLVVFVHGLNSRPEELAELTRGFQDAGYACAMFRYPNDQPLDHSARLLADELRRTKQTDGLRRVVLVTHSMGGLLARAVVEDPQLDSGNVERLIMIAPPNAGSQLAPFGVALDLVEYFSSDTRRQESGLVCGSIRDGLGEALDDLTPGSAFLQRLNVRPRNADVQYTIVLGRGGPLSRQQYDACQYLLGKLGERHAWAADLQQAIDQHVGRLAELFAGEGDGLVALQRGRLPDVADVVLGNFQHVEILRPSEAADLRQIGALIRARLADTTASAASDRQDRP